MSENTAIKVNEVNKTFKLPHEKAGSVKHLFINFFRRRKGYEKQHVLKDISFEIKKGEFFGIVGRNGSGKSTLLKLLAGVYSPDSGHIQVNGKLVPFIELGVGFNPELTGRENVYLNGALLGFSEKEVDGFYREVVKFAELEKFMDQRLKNYSSGMQVRLAFAMAIRAEADILLIDEILAVGDADFQRKCFEYFNHLKKQKHTVVFVSHDMEAVRQYCDKALLISQGKIVASGTAEDVSKEYTKQFLKKSEQTLWEDGKRWGEGQVRIEKIEAEVKESKIILTEHIKAYADVDGCVIGFKIKNTKGESVTGTNNRLEEQTIESIKKGSEFKIVWEIPNILSDGEFFVDPTIHNKETTVVFDWWEEAIKINIKKARQLPFYSVDPSFNLKINEIKGND